MRIILPALVAAFALPAASSAATASESECGKSENGGYICGVSHPEDLAAIPDTPWIIASGMSNDPAQPGRLTLIDRATGTVRALPHDKAAVADSSAYPGCPGPLPTGRFAPHGISVQANGAGYRLLVVNHSPREAIEIFDLHAGDQGATLAWRGCIPLPEGSFANSVTGLPDGGVAATFWVSSEYFAGTSVTDPVAALTGLELGRPTGHVSLWRGGQGWTRLKGSEGSIPNGIELARDGQSVWTSYWGDRKIVRQPLQGGAPLDSIELGFLADNVRWGSDGHLWVAGHHGTPGSMVACMGKADCRVDYAISRIDPDNAKATAIARPDTLDRFDAATVALETGGELWLGSARGDRIAVMTLP